MDGWMRHRIHLKSEFLHGTQIDIYVTEPTQKPERKECNTFSTVEVKYKNTKSARKKWKITD